MRIIMSSFPLCEPRACHPERRRREGSAFCCAMGVSLSDRSENLPQYLKRPIDRLLVMCQRHEVVCRSFEQEPPRRTAPRHIPRNILGRKVEKAHLRDSADARHQVGVLTVHAMEPMQ